jgi:hypothetical protein
MKQGREKYKENTIGVDIVCFDFPGLCGKKIMTPCKPECRPGVLGRHWDVLNRVCTIGHVHYRDGRDSRFSDAGGITERVAFCRYN